MKTPMKTFALAVASLGLAATSAPAFAGTTDARSVEISAAGLDLSTPEGQRMLDQRINQAARKVCGYDKVRTGTRIRSHESVECLAKARASAKSQVATLIADQQRGG